MAAEADILYRLSERLDPGREVVIKSIAGAENDEKCLLWSVKKNANLCGHIHHTQELVKYLTSGKTISDLLCPSCEKNGVVEYKRMYSYDGSLRDLTLSYTVNNLKIHKNTREEISIYIKDKKKKRIVGNIIASICSRGSYAQICQHRSYDKSSQAYLICKIEEFLIIKRQDVARRILVITRVSNGGEYMQYGFQPMGYVKDKDILVLKKELFSPDHYYDIVQPYPRNGNAYWEWYKLQYKISDTTPSLPPRLESIPVETMETIREKLILSKPTSSTNNNRLFLWNPDTTLLPYVQDAFKSIFPHHRTTFIHMDEEITCFYYTETNTQYKEEVVYRIFIAVSSEENYPKLQQKALLFVKFVQHIILATIFYVPEQKVIISIETVRDVDIELYEEKGFSRVMRRLVSPDYMHGYMIEQ